MTTVFIPRVCMSVWIYYLMFCVSKVQNGKQEAIYNGGLHQQKAIQSIKRNTDDNRKFSVKCLARLWHYVVVSDVGIFNRND